MIHNITDTSKNDLIIQPYKQAAGRVEFSQTGFPILKNKIPLSESTNSASLNRGNLYLINLQTTSLL
jgi:hypothetical protein